MIKGTKDRPSVKSLKRVVTPGSSSSLITPAKTTDIHTDKEKRRFLPLMTLPLSLVVS